MMNQSRTSNEEVKAFMMAMKKRYDLDFTNYELNSLSRGVTRLLAKHKMNGMLDLWSKILKEDSFFLNSIDDLLVNLTELFRNPEAWLIMQGDVLQQLVDKSSIDIWHAGCSTGEEVCTMAIILEENNLLYKSRILATDLSQKALAQARTGTYSLSVMKNYARSFGLFAPGRKLSDFFDFHEEQEEATIKAKYTKSVTYRQHNLVTCEMDQQFDIIFCRNVLIYFDGVLKERILNFLNSHLNEGGFLVLGYYDTIAQKTLDIFDVQSQEARIYRKKETKNNEQYPGVYGTPPLYQRHSL